MVLVDVDIAGEEDDWQVKHVTGGEYTAEYALSNATWGYARYGTPATDFTGSRVFYLFRGITIPQGSIIDNATLVIPQIEVVGATPLPFTIRAVNNSAPTNQADYQAYTGTGPAFNTPVLTPVVTFSPTDSVATDFPVDVKAHVQALVDAFDYSNDNMLFRLAKKPNLTTTLNFEVQGFEYQVNPPDSSANLTINYTEGDCLSDFCEDFDEYAFQKLPTSRDNFNYSTQAIADLAWVTTDTTKMRVDPVNEKIEIDAFMDGTDDHVTFDLGFVVSDTWTLRGRITFVSAPGFGTAGSGIYFGLSSNKDDSSAVTQDNAYMGYLHSSIIEQWGVEWGVSNLPTDFFSVPIVETLPLGTELYWELKREGNVLTGQIFNNSDFTDSRGKPTLSTFNGTGFPKNLRFIKFYNRFVDAQTNRVTWEADDIEFWDKGQQGDITFQDDFIQKVTTFSDDFSSYADQTEADASWVPVGTTIRVNPTTDVMDWDFTKVSGNRASAFDLGVNGVSDTNWTLRWKHTYDTVGDTSSSANIGNIGLYNSDETVGSSSTQDFITFKFFKGINTTTTNFIGLQSGDGIIVNDGGGDSTFANQKNPIGGTTLFFELKRTSATTYEGTIYSDANYTTVLDTLTETVASTTTGLRYIKVQNDDRVAVGGGTFDGTLDDIEFYNGESTLTDWTQTGTKVVLNTLTEVVDWDANRDTFNHAISHDLQKSIGTNADDENWTLRFKWLVNNLTNPTGSEPDILHITLSQSDDSVTSGTAQEHIQIAFQAESAPNLRKAFIEAGTGSLHSATDVPFTDDLWSAGTPLFVELKRTSVTSYEASLYSDVNYRNLIERITSTSVDATVNALRYIKIQNRTDTATDGVFNGIIDDIEFYNGVSVPRTPIEEIKDHEDNFIEDDFTNINGSKVSVNTTTQVIDWSSSVNAVYNEGEFNDIIGKPISTDRWTLRCKLVINTATVGSDTTANDLFIGFSDSSTALPQNASDFIGWRYSLNNPNLVGVIRTLGEFSNNQPINGAPGGGGTIYNFPVQVGTFYLETSRNGSNVTGTIYSDPDFTQVIEAVTSPIDVGITGLRFLKVMVSNVDGSADHTYDGTIDDIQFWDGQNALDHKNKWRNIDL